MLRTKLLLSYLLISNKALTARPFSSRTIKKVIAVLITAHMVSQPVFAACLDDKTTGGVVYSKIRGFYVNRTDSDHFVILDKSSCVAAEGTTEVGNNTKQYYYLFFNDQDKMLQSSLLTAYSKDELVEFRLGSIKSGYNQIAYAIVPAYARSQ